jgi:predicted nucleotidyltransferase
MRTQFNKIKKILTAHKEQLVNLGTRHLSIFGSASRGEAKASSDIDILVDFDAKKGIFVFADLKFFLEEILKTDVEPR